MLSTAQRRIPEVSLAGSRHDRSIFGFRDSRSGFRVPGSRWAALEATQGQMDGFCSQLPYQCYLEEVASVGE